MAARQRHETFSWRALSSTNPRQDRALASNLETPILLKNYFLPSDSDLETHIGAFMDHYNHQRYHESLNNVTPSDVYFERDKAILKQRERIKQNTLEAQRLYHRKQTA
jgi:putative transposase